MSRWRVVWGVTGHILLGLRCPSDTGEMKRKINNEYGVRLQDVDGDDEASHRGMYSVREGRGRTVVVDPYMSRTARCEILL